MAPRGRYFGHLRLLTHRTRLPSMAATSWPPALPLPTWVTTVSTPSTQAAGTTVRGFRWTQDGAVENFDPLAGDSLQMARRGRMPSTPRRSPNGWATDGPRYSLHLEGGAPQSQGRFRT